MENYLEGLKNILMGTIDFEGQKLAEKINFNSCVFFGVFAFLIGFATQNVYHTLYIGLFGTLVTFILVVPPWPMYRRNPVQWLNSSTTKSD